MSYKVLITPNFKKSFKKLYKKYPQLKADLQKLIESLSTNPTTGTHLGHNLYKLRTAISSKGKGKSAGARIITFLIIEDREIYLIHIYDKSQLGNLSKDKILAMLKKSWTKKLNSRYLINHQALPSDN